MNQALPTKSELEDLLPYLTGQERAEMEALLSEIGFFWGPQPGPQTMAINSEAQELLYGGAAGGGKTDLIVGLAMLGGFKKALIVRKSFPQLQGNIIPRSNELYQGVMKYNVIDKRWNGGGRSISFRPFDTMRDADDFQGTDYDFIAPDELTQLLEVQYLYLVSRLRKAGDDPSARKCRIVATANPGGIGHAWVKKRWGAWIDKKHPNPAKPGELRWYATCYSEDAGERVDTDVGGPEPFIDPYNGEIVYPRSRTFIPARLSDNKYLGVEYVANLQSLGEPFRSQLLYGDWSAGEEDGPNQLIPTAWVEAAMSRWSERGGDGQIANVIGVDVARGGGDKTVMAERRGTWFARLLTYPGASTKTGDSVIDLLVPLMIKGGVACVDVIGVGSSVYDAGVRRGLNIYGCNFGCGTNEVDRTGMLRFSNERAKYWWRMREALDPETGNGLALPPDPELLGDLTAPSWDAPGGVVKVESKDDLKKPSRLGRSPDKGDAVVMANGMNMVDLDTFGLGGQRGARSTRGY